LPDDDPESDEWLKAVAPHAVAVAGFAGDGGLDPSEAWTLLNECGSKLYRRGHGSVAVDVFEAAQTLTTRLLGPEHPDTLTSMNNLSESLRAVGDNQAALDLHREVLETSKQVLGPQHPDTLTSMNNLAVSLRAVGDNQAALDLHREVL
jgi:hypothetical protein